MPEAGIGWYPVLQQPYDRAYWEKYLAYDGTAVGTALTACRVALVRAHHRGSVVDIGIGGGRFVLEHGNATGFDINPVAVEWLQAAGLWTDPHASIIEAATFWDSIEHIHDPGYILRNVRRYAFASLPIFRDCAHVLASKHFRPDEHCWYFTRPGFERFMQSFGFRVIDHSTMEQRAGREDIESFVCERVQ